MAATLDDIKKELIANRKVTDDILKTNTALVSEMTEYFKDLKEAARQNLLNQKENKREAKATTPGAFGKAFAAQQPKGKGLFGIPGLGVLQTLLGSLAAVSLALAGLRGWEKAALKNIGSITKSIGMLFPKSVGNSIQNSFLKLRKALLTSVGLDATLKKFGDPKSGLKTSVGAQIFSRFEKFRGRLLNSIGLGVDGKPIVVKGEKGLRVPVLSRIVSSLNNIFEPVSKFADKISNFFKGVGGGAAAKLVGFIKGLGLIGAGAAGAVVGKAAAVGGPVFTLLRKILLPLGVLFSAKAAFDAFFETDEGKPLSKKFENAAFAFLADFIGAPLNLLRDGISFLFNYAFGIKTDKDGNVLPDQGVGGKIAEVIKSFDFVALIKNIPDFVRTVINNILGFLKDPIGVGKDVLGDVIGGLKNLLFSAMRALLYAIDIPGAKKIADTYFMTNEQKQAKIREQINQTSMELEAERYVNSLIRKSLENELVFDEYTPGGRKRLDNPLQEAENSLAIRNLNTSTGLLAEKMEQLMKENKELLQKIGEGASTSVVNAPTNNVNNVSQGINYPFPGAITNALVYR